MKELREKHPSLVLGIKTTITRYNIDELDRVCQYADEHSLFTIISPYILTSNRYDNLGKEDELSLSAQDLVKLKTFYNSPRFRWSYYRNELLNFLATGRMEKPCSAGFNYFFIRSTRRALFLSDHQRAAGECKRNAPQRSHPLRRGLLLSQGSRRILRMRILHGARAGTVRPPL